MITNPLRGGRGLTRPPSASRLPPSGMTLIELIVAITIVAILGALLLGVAATAGGVAREARTNSMITRLHTLLMERYDEYRTRRVELKPYTDNTSHRILLTSAGGFLEVSDYGASAKYPLGDPRIAAFTRLAALREMMKVEMPDRWSDIAGYKLDSLPSTLVPPQRPFLFLEDEPTLWSVYARALNRSLQREADGDTTTEAILANQGAECLYLVIMNATGDGEARGLFKETDVADTDGDGALEFLDGWGNPISYLRWAPGFESDAQLSVPGLQDIYRDAERDTNDNGLSGSEAVTNAILADHSPYDLFRVDNPVATVPGFNATTDVVSARGWRLVPLILSAGADEEFGLLDGLDTSGSGTIATVLVGANPYGDGNTSLTGLQRLGGQTDFEAAADNIHNHQAGSLVRTR